MSARFAHALIVGGSGMLADATRGIARRAERVTLASRRPERLAAEIGAETARIDWADAATLDALAERAADAPPDLLVSWLHDEAVALAPALEALLRPGGLSVRIHGAASGDAAVLARRNPSPRADVVRRTVVLGWVAAPDGLRWLTDAEISSAALRALDEEAEVSLAGTHAGEAPGEVRLP